MALRRSIQAEPSEFETAKARWAAVTAQRRELDAKLAGAQAALAMAKAAEGDHISPIFAERAKTYLNGRVVNVDRLRRELADIEDAITQAGPTLTAERAAWTAAQSAEAQRLIAVLKPRHAAAVRKLAAAVTALSAAIEAERAVRAELTDTGSAALPDASHGLGGTLTEYNGALATWNRRVLAAGLLD